MASVRLSRLKLARMKAGLRQIDLARKVGVSETAITKYETGRARPSLVTLQRICQVLGAPLDDLAQDFES